MPGVTRKDPFNVVIASNFTVEPIRDVIRYWANHFLLSYKLSFEPFNQVLQSLINPESLFSRNKNGANLIFLRMEDCLTAPWTSIDGPIQIENFLNDFEKALSLADINHSVPLVVIECPRSIESREDSEFSLALATYRQRLIGFKEKFNSLHFIGEDEVFGLYPLKNYEDSFAYNEAKIPYTLECFTALGTISARTIVAMIRKPYKVIVLDCDNTLWRGVSAEDGVANLEINSNYKNFQTLMVHLQQRGFLLCLCSKNIEKDVWSVFDYCEPAMPLKKHHIVASRINWLPKSENIKSLSEELNLGLDSFIFIDDSEAQCAEVRAFCPEVACFQFPLSSDDIPAFLKHLWVFDQLEKNIVDQKRSLFYQQEKQRALLAKAAFSFEEFIDNLQLKLTFSFLGQDQIERIAQMSRRVNQFNLTGDEISAFSLKHSYINGNKYCLVINAQDRYGEYGIIACAFYAIDGEFLVLDNLLISCRALGKKIEFKIWERLSEIAIEKGLSNIYVKFIKTKRNEAALLFLKALGMNDAAEENEIGYTHFLGQPVLC